MLHRTIKKRDAIFSSLKDSVLFCIEVFDCQSLKCLLKSGTKGISNRKIRELITYVYSLAILGICVEMTEDLNVDEIIVFGGMIDLGSKIKKTKEYVSVGVKYCCIALKALVARVIGLRCTASKTGLAVIKILVEALNHFNGTIKRCKSVLGHLFPVTEQAYHPLQLEYMESLGVDGALISDIKMINKQLLECNPRCQVNWCEGYHPNLISNDAVI